MQLSSKSDNVRSFFCGVSIIGLAVAAGFGGFTDSASAQQGATQAPPQQAVGGAQPPLSPQEARARQQQAEAIRQSVQLLAPAEAPVIKGLSVQGNQRIEPETVASYLTLQPGMNAEEELLDLQVKTLYETGLFSDVAAEMQPNGTLLIAVTENPIVNRVLFEGNKKLKEDKFTEEIQLTARSVYTRAKVQADQQRMIELYRASGRFATTITPKVVPLDQNRVDVVFEIDEGPKTGIAKVNFVGNEVFTSGELSNVILTSESRWWNFFGASTSNYDPDRLEFERELLRQHYAKNGYADFKVDTLVAELTPDRKEFFVTFTVTEGPKYTVGEVKVRSALDKLDENAFQRFVSIKTGQTFDGERVEKAVESLTFITGASGYAFVDVNPRLTRYPESKTVDITFDINEGPKVYVERINIKGNTTTLDKVVRRELRLTEGDPFNKVQVDRSESVIRSLGFFSDVTIEEKPGSAPDRTELDVTVSEQATGSFSVGVGVSSTDSFIADVSVEQRNFLGRGEAARFRVQFSQRTRQVDLRYTIPRFLDRNLTAGASIFYSRVDNSINVNNGDRGLGGFIQEQIGFGFNLGFQVSEFGQAGINYQFSRANVDFGIDSRITPVFNVPNPSFAFIPNPDFNDESPPGTPALIANGPENLTLTALALDEDGNLITPLGPNSTATPAGLFAPAGTANAGGIIDPLTDPVFGLPNNVTNFQIAPLGTTGSGLALDDNDFLLSNGALALDPLVAALNGSAAPAFIFDDCDPDLVVTPFRCESEGRFTTSLLSGTLAFSTVNDPFNPRTGWRARGTVSIAGLGGNVQFARAEFDSAYYKPLYKDFIGVLKLRGGYITGFAGDTVRIQDRFRQGAASFRGFEISGVGPRIIIPTTSIAVEDPENFAELLNFVGSGGFETGNGVSFQSQSIGGNAYLIGTAEVLVPLPLPPSYGIRASIFTDFGTVGLVDDETLEINDNPGFGVSILGLDIDGDGLIDPTPVNTGFGNDGEINPNAGQDIFFAGPVQDALSFRLSAGVTISWNSPFGPIRFDIAEVFIREFFDETEFFRFSAGTTF